MALDLVRLARWVSPGAREPEKEERVGRLPEKPKDPRPMRKPCSDDEIDDALRQIGDEYLDRDIPERLLRVLRGAKPPAKRQKPTKGD